MTIAATVTPVIKLATAITRPSQRKPSIMVPCQRLSLEVVMFCIVEVYTLLVVIFVSCVT